MIEYSAGIVTAYGAAKRAGYTGTYEDFCRQQAQYADNASAVEQAKQTAVSASQSAVSASTTAQTAERNAKASEQSASTQAQLAGQSAQDAQTAESNAQTYAQSASASAGSAQQSAQTAQAVLESIPEDYSDLAEDVDKLKADLGALDDNVKSGIEYAADGQIYIPFSKVVGETVRTDNGAIETDSTYTRSSYIPINGGETLYIDNPQAATTHNVYYNADKEFVAYIYFNHENGGKLVVPDNARYIIYSNKTQYFDGMRLYRKNKVLEETAYNVNFTNADCTYGFIIGNTGGFSANNLWLASDFVPLPMINGGTAEIKCTLYVNGGLAFYDRNKRYIDGVSGNTASAHGHTSSSILVARTFTVPEQTCYVRISMYLYNQSTFNATMMFINASIGIKELASNFDKYSHSIYALNETESMYVNAGANYGHHSGGSANTEKRFSMLVTTDVHKDDVALKRAVDYLNVMPCFDCGTCLGDLQGNGYSDNDGTWYTNVIKNAKKPWLTIIGNHDVGLGKKIAKTGNQQQVYEKFIEPNYQYAGIEDPDANYYYKDFATYKIRIICLCAYDVDDNTTSGDEYVVPRYTEYYSQAQITWFVNTLASTPSDYQVVVMFHNTPLTATKDTSIKFNNKVYNLSPESTQNGIITDIINAWQNGTTLSETYPCTNTTLSSVVVTADFTSRGTGVFICYLTGHMHVDFVGHITKYPSQTVLAFSATNTGTYQNGKDDIPRADYTKAEDCITSLAVDTTAKNIYIVRIGASVSKYFDVREPSAIPYT